MHATAPRTTDASRSHSAVPSADTLADGAVGGSSSRESADRPSRRRTSDNTQPPAPRRDRPWKLPLGVTAAAPGARVGARPRCTSSACTRPRSTALDRYLRACSPSLPRLACTSPRRGPTDAPRSKPARQATDTLADGAVGGPPRGSRRTARLAGGTSDNTQPPAPRQRPAVEATARSDPRSAWRSRWALACCPGGTTVACTTVACTTRRVHDPATARSEPRSG